MVTPFRALVNDLQARVEQIKAVGKESESGPMGWPVWQVALPGGGLVEHFGRGDDCRISLFARGSGATIETTIRVVDAGDDRGGEVYSTVRKTTRVNTYQQPKLYFVAGVESTGRIRHVAYTHTEPTHAVGILVAYDSLNAPEKLGVGDTNQVYGEATQLNLARAAGVELREARFAVVAGKAAHSPAYCGVLLREDAYWERGEHKFAEPFGLFLNGSALETSGRINARSPRGLEFVAAMQHNGEPLITADLTMSLTVDVAEFAKTLDTLLTKASALRAAAAAA